MLPSSDRLSRIASIPGPNSSKASQEAWAEAQVQLSQFAAHHSLPLQEQVLGQLPDARDLAGHDLYWLGDSVEGSKLLSDSEKLWVIQALLGESGQESWVFWPFEDTLRRSLPGASSWIETHALSRQAWIAAATRVLQQNSGKEIPWVLGGHAGIEAFCGQCLGQEPELAAKVRRISLREAVSSTLPSAVLCESRTALALTSIRGVAGWLGQPVSAGAPWVVQTWAVAGVSRILEQVFERAGFPRGEFR
jgi:hypothetical protein